MIGAVEERFRGERDPICVFPHYCSATVCSGIFFTLSMGELGARVMQVIAIIILARRLGSKSFGYFILATTITTYLLLFVQLGLDIIAVRYVSQKQFGLSDLVASILGLRLTVATIVTVGLFIYVFIFGTDDPINRLLLIMSGLYFTNALSLRWPLLAREMMTPLALASFISQFCFFLGALLVLNNSQAAFAALAQVAGEVFAALYVWLAFNARCGHVRPSIDILLMRRLLSETWPIFPEPSSWHDDVQF